MNFLLSSLFVADAMAQSAPFRPDRDGTFWLPPAASKSAAEIDDMSNGDEVRKAREVLKAVRQFNLRKVAKLMSVDVPQPLPA